MAGAVVNPYAKLGCSCIVNTCASVDHDCIVGNYVHISVGAHICGAVTIGEGVWVGAGSTIINNIRVCPECLLGAGSVVVKDIDQTGTYVGVPAKQIYY